MKQPKRTQYGEAIVASLSQQLTLEYGRGWGEKHLRHCLRFAETFPDEQIVSALRRQLNWSHFKEIMYLEHGCGSPIAAKKRMCPHAKPQSRQGRNHECYA